MNDLGAATLLLVLMAMSMSVIVTFLVRFIAPRMGPPPRWMPITWWVGGVPFTQWIDLRDDD